MCVHLLAQAPDAVQFCAWSPPQHMLPDASPPDFALWVEGPLAERLDLAVSPFLEECFNHWFATFLPWPPSSLSSVIVDLQLSGPCGLGSPPAVRGGTRSLLDQFACACSACAQGLATKQADTSLPIAPVRKLRGALPWPSHAPCASLPTRASLPAWGGASSSQGPPPKFSEKGLRGCASTTPFRPPSSRP